MPVLFVSDLDGTLLQEDHSLAPETLAAIRHLHDAGRTFAIATGRHHTDVADLAKQIDRPIGMISCNGGMAIAPMDGSSTSRKASMAESTTYSC